MSTRLRVSGRVRPLAPDGEAASSSSCLRLFEGNVLEVRERGQWGAKSFCLDRVYAATDSQKQVFDEELVPLLTAALSGYNGANCGHRVLFTTILTQPFPFPVPTKGV